jgi:hypothetical protein
MTRKFKNPFDSTSTSIIIVLIIAITALLVTMGSKNQSRKYSQCPPDASQVSVRNNDGIVIIDDVLEIKEIASKSNGYRTWRLTICDNAGTYDKEVKGIEIEAVKN